MRKPRTKEKNELYHFYTVEENPQGEEVRRVYIFPTHEQAKEAADKRWELDWISEVSEVFSANDLNYNFTREGEPFTED